jgi:hypothetical protein
MQTQSDPPPVRRLLRTREDDNLWRVFPAERALQLFNEKKNVMVAPRKWDDPFENFLARCRVPIDTNQFAALDQLTMRFYGQCWCHSEAETDATWRIYAPEKQRGIRIRVRAGTLFDTIYSRQDQNSAVTCFLGQVKYLPEDELTSWLCTLNVVDELLTSNGVGIAETLLTKRIQFGHENETRLLFVLPAERYNGNEILKFDCDPNILVQHVLLDPRWSEPEAKLMEQKLRRLGYQGAIEHSTLYSVPNFINLQPLSG